MTRAGNRRSRAISARTESALTCLTAARLVSVGHAGQCGDKGRVNLAPGRRNSGVRLASRESCRSLVPAGAIALTLPSVAIAAEIRTALTVTAQVLSCQETLACVRPADLA